MRKKKVNNEKKSTSLRTLFFYGIIVFILIMVAFAVRVYTVIEKSRFDGEHRFTLAVVNSEKVLVLFSFEPLNSSLSMLRFANNLHISSSSLNKSLGIIPDGSLKIRNTLDSTNNIPPILQALMWSWNSTSRNITFYDLIRFWYYSHKIPVSTVNNKELSSLSDLDDVDRAVLLLFGDSVIASENVSIQIINAAGESGLAQRLSRVISNLGGNVVSVQTGPVQDHSEIQYYGNETYTSNKLYTLLHYNKKKSEMRAIAEIVIIIGKDAAGTKVY